MTQNRQALAANVLQSALLLGVDEHTLRNHRHGNEISLGDDVLRVLRIGKRILVPFAELARVLQVSVEEIAEQVAAQYDEPEPAVAS